MLPGKSYGMKAACGTNVELTAFFKYRKIVLDKSRIVCYYNKALRGQVLHRNTGDAGKMLV